VGPLSPALTPERAPLAMVLYLSVYSQLKRIGPAWGRCVSSLCLHPLFVLLFFVFCDLFFPSFFAFAFGFCLILFAPLGLKCVIFFFFTFPLWTSLIFFFPLLSGFHFRILLRSSFHWILLRSWSCKDFLGIRPFFALTDPPFSLLCGSPFVGKPPVMGLRLNSTNFLSGHFPPLSFGVLISFCSYFVAEAFFFEVLLLRSVVLRSAFLSPFSLARFWPSQFVFHSLSILLPSRIGLFLYHFLFSFRGEWFFDLLFFSFYFLSWAYSCHGGFVTYVVAVSLFNNFRWVCCFPIEPSPPCLSVVVCFLFLFFPTVLHFFRSIFVFYSAVSTRVGWKVDFLLHSPPYFFFGSCCFLPRTVTSCPISFLLMFCHYLVLWLLLSVSLLCF